MNIPKSYEALAADLASEKIISKTLQGQKESYMMLADGRKFDLDAIQQRLTVAEQRAAELTASLQLATRLLNASKANLKPTGKLGKDIRDFLNSRHKEDVAKLRGFFSKKSTDNSEDEQDQRVGFVRTNTKTDQPRISMADMHARYERKPCQEPQAHPTRCECEDLSHDQ